MASQLSSQLSFSLTEIRSDMLPGISSEDNEDDSTENSNLSSASVSDPGISSKANDDEEETQQNVSQRLTLAQQNATKILQSFRMFNQLSSVKIKEARRSFFMECIPHPTSLITVIHVHTRLLLCTLYKRTQDCSTRVLWSTLQAYAGILYNSDSQPFFCCGIFSTISTFGGTHRKR